MNIDGVRLRNFRGFRDVNLELKPLTILLGQNSSGKSSFTHALAAMAHSHWLYRGGQRATLSPTNDSEQWPVDLGTQNDLRTSKQRGRISICLHTKSGWMEFGFGDVKSDRNDLRLSYISHPYSPEIVRSRKISSAESQKMDAIATSEVTQLGTVGANETADSIILKRTDENTWWHANDNVPANVDFDGLILQFVGHAGGTQHVLKGEARESANQFLSQLAYLRGTRKRPSRSYDDRIGPRQAIGYAGEWTASVLRKRAEHSVTFAVPPAIPDTVQAAKAQLEKRWVRKKQPLANAVAGWLHRLGLAKSITAIHSRVNESQLQLRVTLANQKAHDITEIGFGVSQVLPVLVGGLLQPEGSFFAVDLPEAHLHPRPQAALADFFCALVQSGRCALVETHSEMFFHRLRLRAAMNKSLMENIAVYFLDPPDKNGLCQPPRRVRVDYEGELQWPPGFLQEAWETESQINAIREARRQTYL